VHDACLRDATLTE
jgi:uncharacterized protein YjbI with pentapeptide repeats